ncbi:MAG TPA: cytochrome c [Myxococcota bacterium]|nr:cytochrome c [Myxococcota bacterium]
MTSVQRFFRHATLALALVAFACGGGEERPAASQPAPAAPAEAPQERAPAPADAAPAAADSAAGDAAPAAAQAAAPDAKAGEADYQIFCASCHGPKGAGDGPVAQALDPKPAHHNDGNYMNPLTDDYLFKVIKFGGASVGKSAMMAPLGGSLSDAQIRNIIAYIRTLADPPYRP